jgi:pimeloyl-ACP methyl ester carboxylesterase
MYARVSTTPGATGAIGAQGADRALPPVVLVHGLSVSSRYMMPLARHLAPHVAVYVPDLPGFGFSQKPRRVLDVPGLADALAAWMDAVGLERAVFIGNSLGCQTIANLALRQTERVRGALFLGPTMDPDASALRKFLRLMFDLALLEPLSLPLVILVEFLYTGPWWAQRTFHHGLNDAVLEKYARMQSPVLVVRGERDPLVPLAFARQLLALLPGARALVTLRGAGHCLNYNSPAALVGITLPFLRELTSPPAIPDEGRGPTTPVMARRTSSEEDGALEDARAVG